MEFIAKGACKKAAVICRGAGWTLKEFYVGGGLLKFLSYPKEIQIVDEETFLAAARKGNL